MALMNELDAPMLALGSSASAERRPERSICDCVVHSPSLSLSLCLVLTAHRQWRGSGAQGLDVWSAAVGHRVASTRHHPRRGLWLSDGLAAETRPSGMRERERECVCVCETERAKTHTTVPLLSHSLSSSPQATRV
jgi:hypothetical protein